LWTLVLKDWLLNCFGNAHAGNAFHLFAVRVKKSFWNFAVCTVLKVTAQQWVVVPALVSRTRFSRVLNQNIHFTCLELLFVILYAINKPHFIFT